MVFNYLQVSAYFSEVINPSWTATTAGTLNMAVPRVTTRALQRISVLFCLNTYISYETISNRNISWKFEVNNFVIYSHLLQM